jgi:hypothetical protein
MISPIRCCTAVVYPLSGIQPAACVEYHEIEKVLFECVADANIRGEYMTQRHNLNTLEASYI